MTPRVPQGLSPRSIELWKAVVRSGSRSLPRLALLEEALRSLDAVDRYRGLLSSEELVVAGGHGGHGRRVNPLVRAGAAELENFVRIWRLLGLQWDAAVDGGEPTRVVEEYASASDRWRVAGPAGPDRTDAGDTTNGDAAPIVRRAARPARRLARATRGEPSVYEHNTGAIIVR